MSIKSFWKSSTANKLIIVVFFLWIALAVVFGIYDLVISKFLFNSNDSVAKLVESFGEVPGALFIIFTLFIMNTNTKIRNKNYKKLFFIFQIMLSAFLFIYILRTFFVHFGVNFSFLSLEGIALFLGFALVSLFGFYLFKTKFRKFSLKNHLFSKLTLALFILSFVIIEALKLFWGRVRYLDFVNGAGNFSAWYLPQGLTGSYSFPSGHAFFAWVIIPLFLIFTGKKSAWKYVLIILTTLFSLFISYERILMGAHYASDILFSAGIVVLTFLFLYKKNFYGKRNSQTRKKKRKKKKKQ